MSAPLPAETVANDHLGVLLQAYADGSLHPEGCAFIEQQLEAVPGLRDRLADIAAMQARLRTHLPLAAPAPLALDAEHRARVAAAARRPARRLIHLVVPWLAAACLALVAGYLAIPNLAMHHERSSHTMKISSSIDDQQLAMADAVAPTGGEAGKDSDNRQSRDEREQSRRLRNGAEAARSGDDVLAMRQLAKPSSEEKLGEGAQQHFLRGLTSDFAVPAEKDANDAEQPKGRELAAKEETSQDRAFMAVGAGGGAAGFHGARKPASSIEAAKKAKQRPAAPPMPAAPPASMPAPTPVATPAPGYAFAPAAPVVQEPRAKSGNLAAIAERLEKKADKELGGRDQGRRLNELQDAKLAGNKEIQDALEELKPAELDGLVANGLVAAQAAPSADLPTLLGRPVKTAALRGRPAEVLDRLAPEVRFDLRGAGGSLAVPAGGGSAGQQALRAAALNRLQLIPGPAGLALVPAQQPLDPTELFGFSRDALRAAFGSTPMQYIADDAVQTVAIDASTSSFDAARAALDHGRLPDPAACEPQHTVNAVPADYPPATGEDAFALFAEAGPSPFAAGPAAARTMLVACGVVPRAVAADERRAVDLVLAIDASGSMARASGLERARNGLAALWPQLGQRDRVAIVAFGDVARVVLPAVAGDQQAPIAAAMASLSAQGATNAADGIALAYQVAGELAAPGRTVRVLLVTDGAALAGDAAAAAEAVARRWRGHGVNLLAVGCADASYDARALERLAQAGDGSHHVAGSDAAARVLFTSRLVPSRLTVLAQDAKLQVTWNPARVSHARLIGFEQRRLKTEEFRDDRVDAGELGAQEPATALFEVLLAEGGSGPLGTAAVRYRDTRLERVVELARPLPAGLLGASASPRLRLLACAAEFGELLQQGWWRNCKGSTHERLLAELTRLDQPFARVLEPLVRRHADLERQESSK